MPRRVTAFEHYEEFLERLEKGDEPHARRKLATMKREVVEFRRCVETGMLSQDLSLVTFTDDIAASAELTERATNSYRSGIVHGRLKLLEEGDDQLNRSQRDLRPSNSRC